MKTLLDQDQMLARRDELLKQCQQRGISAPSTTRDVCDDVANLEAALGLAPDAPAGKPAAPKATLDPIQYATKASELYEGLPPERRAAFLARNEKEVRAMFQAAERHA